MVRKRSSRLAICLFSLYLFIGIFSSLDANGQTITEFDLPTGGSMPYGITAGPDGNLWFTEINGNKIGRITTAGVITEFNIPTFNSGPSGITAGPDGKLWFTEINGNKIGRITTAGVITEFHIPNIISYGITAGPDGNLWFTEINGNKIGRITTAGVITQFDIPTFNSRPYEITAGPDGNLWFTEINGNKIGRITTAGVITEFNIPTVNSSPYGITAGPDGNIWFTEIGANKIGRITTAGVITEFDNPNSSPVGITSGPDGNLWFTEGNAKGIGRITPAGVITEFDIPTFNSGPKGITAGPDGNIWFTESWYSATKIGRVNLPVEFPTPDVKANNSDDPVTVSPNDPLSITVSLNSGSRSGENADWWMVANTPMGWYHYDVKKHSWQSGLVVTHQGPLFNLSTYEVLNISGLPTGSYIFYFGFDMDMNGSLDMDKAYYDSVIVNVPW